MLANERFARALATQSTSAASDDPLLAVTLAAESITRSSPPLAEGRSALVDARLARRSPGSGALRCAASCRGRAHGRDDPRRQDHGHRSSQRRGHSVEPHHRHRPASVHRPYRRRPGGVGRPRASRSRPPAPTAPCGCGISHRATSSPPRPSSISMRSYGASPSAPTDRRWRPPAKTERSGSSMSRRVSNKALRSASVPAPTSSRSRSAPR